MTKGSIAKVAWRDKLKWSKVSNVGTNVRLLIRIFSYSSGWDRALLSLSFLTSVCAGATLPLMNIIFARLIKTFTTLAHAQDHDISKEFMSIINKYVLYIIYLFIGRLLLAYISTIGFRITSLRISANIRLVYLKALFQQPISTLDLIPPGHTTSIITVTANTLQIGISERLSSLIQALTVITAALIIGCIFCWELTLVTSSGLAAIVLWYTVTTPLIAKRYAAIQDVEMEAAGVASEAFSSVRMVAACGAEDKMSASYGILTEKVRDMGKRMSPLIAVQYSPVFFTVFATYALLFWYAVRLYLQLRFASVEALVVVLMSVMTSLAHINTLSTPLTAVSNAITAGDMFFKIIDAPKPSTSGLKEDEVDMDEDILLENVHFTYTIRPDAKILHGLNLRIPLGKTTAIVGPSGSGKSTTVALIQRWFELGGSDPIANYFRNGIVRIGERKLNEIDLHWWRAQIGLVQQEPFLFNDTIYKNVEYGLTGTEWENSSAEIKNALVAKACKEAYVDEFVRALPDGYETSVGEVGLHLSGGQRQRVAIARAIVRQPRILIFDEATSALDVTSERIVQNALDRAAQNRTTIVIAHRLSTIKNADNIAVVVKGQVVQQGTHKSLLEQTKGPYWTLVNAQQITTSPRFQDNYNSLDEKGHGPPSQRQSFNLEQFWDEKLLRLDSRRESRRESILLEKDSYETLVESEITAVEEARKVAQEKPPPTSLYRALHMLLSEQKTNWPGYLLLLIAAIGAAASAPTQAYLFGRLISSFSTWGGQLRVSTTFLCVLLVAVAGGIGLSYFTLGWVSNYISRRTVSHYRAEYFHNIITKRISFFDHANHSTGLLTTRVATDPAQLQQLLGINMAMVLISVFSLIGCITVAMLFSWRFAIVVIAPSLPIILAGGWYRVRFEVRFVSRNNEVFAESARFATEAIGAIRTVASLTLERAICDSYEKMLQKHIVKSWKEARFSCLVFAASDSMILLCMAFSLWYGGKLLSRAEITPFQFLVVYLAIIQGTLAAGQWLSFGPNIAQVSEAAMRIKMMRKSDADDQDKVWANYQSLNRWTIPASLIWRGADIEFCNIWFTYPTRNVPVLRGLSLNIRHGQFAAIVGSSGSGKTTVISLLERFYEPQRGTIWYNGEETSSIPLSVLRSRMSLVAQEPHLFRGTIRDNVLLGVHNKEVSEDVLHQACKQAGIHDFVSSLPEGYNTDVGTKGISLSGGQKQRISIARALIRNPSVLLLDEATSSLDSETEKEIQKVFERTGQGRTMVVVAHRLATVRNADVIFVMNEGRVVEKGDHGRLLRKKGVYWQMCQAQALGT